MKGARPEYPLRVEIRGGNSYRFANEEELVTTLEWFDTDDPEYKAIACDQSGRRIHLKVERLEITTLRFQEELE